MNIKKKIIKMLLILIASIVLALLSNSKVYGNTKSLKNVTFSYNELGNYIGDVSFQRDLATASNKNLYCVDHNGSLSSTTDEKYRIKGYAEIDGDNVRIYGNWDQADKSGYIEYKSDYAQTIAMILNENNNLGYGHGYGTSNGTTTNPTKAQKALWAVWDDFLSIAKDQKLDNSIDTSWGSRS